MKNMFFVLILIVPAVLFSDSSWPEQSEIIYPEIITVSGIENPVLSILENMFVYPDESEKESSVPSTLKPKWGADFLVSSGNTITPSKTNLAFDYDLFGRLYTAISDDASTFDTLWIFNSTDKGQTWTRKLEISISPPYTSDILYHDMKIQHGTNYPEIYQFFLIDNGYDTTLWFRTIDFFGHNPVWLRFTPDSLFSQISKFSFDISGDSFYIIYLRRPNAEGSKVVRMFSFDRGITWTRQSVTDFPSKTVDISARPDGYFYIVYDRISEADIFIHRYDNSGSLLDIQTVSIPGLYSCYPSLSSARFKPWGDNFVYVVYQEGTGVSTRAKISTSSDGGGTWTIAQKWPIVGDFNSRCPFVEFSRSDTQDRCIGIAVNSDNHELRMCINGYGEHWDSAITVNDHIASSEVQPQGCFVSSIINSQTGIIYRQFGSDSIWFDGELTTTSVEETTENINFINGTDILKISFISPQNIYGKIELLDVSGRVIKTIYEGSFCQGENTFRIPTEDLDQTLGVYFILINSRLITNSQKVTIFR
ncbi:hypothetical protein JXA84_09420 [candidate division WOR-3 bacterium]|nr:hypothetical protein [candidate division WOR-3 bacterium]